MWDEYIESSFQNRMSEIIYFKFEIHEWCFRDFAHV